MKRTVVMFISMTAMIVAFVVWSMMSPIAPQLQKVFGLTVFQKSLVVATPILLGSLLRIPLGILTDRFGGRKVYTLMLLFLIIPLFGLSAVHSFTALLVWEVLLGVAGASFAVGIAYVSTWYPSDKQGLVLGITAIGNIGTAVAGFIVPTIFLHLGFANTFRIMMIPVLLAAAIVWLFTRDNMRIAAPSKNGKGVSYQPKQTGVTAGDLLTDSKLWLLSMFYFITFGGFVAFGNYLPTLLQSQFQLHPVDAGLRAAGFVVLATILRPIGGYLADKVHPNALLRLVFFIMTFGAIILAVGLNNMAMTTVSALTIAAMLGIGNGTVFKLVPSYFPNATGKATGIIGAIGGLGGFFPPLVMGFVKQQTGSFVGGLALLAVFCGVALLLTMREGAKGSVKKTRPARS